MAQSTLSLVDRRRLPRHVAVIMDGNGRWATRRGRPRTAGHLAGARATRRLIEHAARAGIHTLTVYAFSADNWTRPADEVGALMRLFARYLAAESARCVRAGIRLQIIGRRDRLDPTLRSAIETAEGATRDGGGLRVRLAIDYSARDAIATAHAAGAVPDPAPPDTAPPRDAGEPQADRARFARALARAVHDADPPGDVDLLVRTGGEQRLSDFLLWECAYAELWFTDVLWPDFGARDLAAALAAFAARDRRFGGLSGRDDASPVARAIAPAVGARRSCA